MNRIPSLYKRNPYRKHYCTIKPEMWKQICIEFQNKNSINSLYLRTGIPKTTLYTWKMCYTNNNKWAPYNNRKGKCNRIFTKEEEEYLVTYIKNLLQTGNIFTNEDFKEIALAYYYNKQCNDNKPISFSCSNGFINDFKKRHKFSSKKFHFKRRPDLTHEQEIEWIMHLKDLLNTVENQRIVNCDETAYNLYPKGLLTWAIRGEDNVKSFIDGNDKENITVLASITADGKKLPLMFIAKGITVRSENSQINDIGSHWKTHTSNGWMTNDAFITYLINLRLYFSDNNEIHLILDCYAAHRSEPVKEYAQLLNIILHFIPPGMTDEFQPLDRKIFGIVKAYAKRLYRMRIKKTGKISKKDACQDMIQAWENIDEIPIFESWDIYQE